MIALAVGTGVGINTAMAYFLGTRDRKRSDEAAGISTALSLVMWAVFALLAAVLMPAYARMSTESEAVIADVIVYGRIVCVCSIGLFLESGWTKVLQAEGNMNRPMAAQILGAVTNIVLDPLLIFGLFGLPALGIAGAAVATVAGQIVAAAIVWRGGYRRSPEWALYPALVRRVYRLGIPNILMQSAYTFYILGLNLILSTFSDQAVTALGLYYKWQTFFFIPLGAMQTCIVPVISYNYAAGSLDRCRKTLRESILAGMALMLIGTLCFELIPGPMLRFFSPGCRGHRHRDLWVPVDRSQFFTHGDIPDFPGILSGSGQRREKLPADDFTDGGAVCAAGLAVRPLGAARLLAHIPCYGADYNGGGLSILPAVPPG